MAQEATSTPPPAPQTPAANTNVHPGALSAEELTRQVIKPHDTKAPISTMPTFYDTRPAPELSTDAQKHQYLGFRLGMTVEEAMLLAQTAGKSLTEMEKDRRYGMDGALTEVPKPEKARTILAFKEGKLDLIMIFWDDNNTLFVNLEPIMLKKYGKSLRVDELFRRFWVLPNDDCIRMLYNVADHQTSIVYGSKQAVFDMNEREKREIQKDQFKGL